MSCMCIQKILEEVSEAVKKTSKPTRPTKKPFVILREDQDSRSQEPKSDSSNAVFFNFGSQPNNEAEKDRSSKLPKSNQTPHSASNVQKEEEEKQIPNEGRSPQLNEYENVPSIEIIEVFSDPKNLLGCSNNGVEFPSKFDQFQSFGNLNSGSQDKRRPLPPFQSNGVSVEKPLKPESQLYLSSEMNRSRLNSLSELGLKLSSYNEADEKMSISFDRNHPSQRMFESAQNSHESQLKLVDPSPKTPFFGTRVQKSSSLSSKKELPDDEFNPELD